MVPTNLRPEHVIDKALEKDRDIRYQHAADLLTDLKRLKRQTESARVVVADVPPDRKLKRRKLWVAAGCFAAIVLALAGAWYMRSGRTYRIDSIAVLPFTNGDANTEYLSDGITESLIDSLAHVPPACLTLPRYPQSVRPCRSRSISWWESKEKFGFLERCVTTPELNKLMRI